MNKFLIEFYNRKKNGMEKFNKAVQSSNQLIKWRIFMDFFKNEIFSYVFLHAYVLLT